MAGRKAWRAAASAVGLGLLAGAVLAQDAKAREGKSTNLAALLAKGQTWTVSGTAADPV